ncbi:MAG TPA: nuclear transport factor 2 family protein [Chthoniobacterales bacterium]
MVDVRFDSRPDAVMQAKLFFFCSYLYLLSCAFSSTAPAADEATLASETPNPAKSSPDEQTLWQRERDYWRYVEANDLAAYSNLWHNDFLGWPSVSAAPVRKDQITDWITSQTSKGLSFKTGEFKPAAIHITEHVAMVYYRITFRWLDKGGNGPEPTLRITHAWLKTGGEWRIIGGMSMPEAEPAH